MLVCDEGNIEMVDLLLLYSADPNLQQLVSKMEVLYTICLFCLRGSLNCMQYLSDPDISHVANCVYAAVIHISKEWSTAHNHCTFIFIFLFLIFL